MTCGAQTTFTKQNCAELPTSRIFFINYLFCEVDCDIKQNDAREGKICKCLPKFTKITQICAKTSFFSPIKHLFWLKTVKIDVSICESVRHCWQYAEWIWDVVWWGVDGFLTVWLLVDRRPSWKGLRGACMAPGITAVGSTYSKYACSPRSSHSSNFPGEANFSRVSFNWFASIQYCFKFAQFYRDTDMHRFFTIKPCRVLKSGNKDEAPSPPTPPPPERRPEQAPI